MLCPLIALDLRGREPVREADLDDAPLNCALEALRDGLTGQLQWRYSDAGGVSDHGGLWLRGDGTAVYDSLQTNDVCVDELGEVAEGTLEPPPVFDAWLAVELIWERFDCVRGALATKTMVCQERVVNCDGA